MMLDLIRKETSDKWGMKRLQNCILNIAFYIDEFCQKNSIGYCLMGGSALGALRHSGFIPWDDDLDIFMTPDDYEKFRDCFNKEGDKAHYYLQEIGAAGGLVTRAKLRLNRSTFIEEVTKDWDIHHGVFIDIFILHAYPDGRLSRAWMYLWAKYLVIKGLANKSYYKKGPLLNTIVWFFKLLPKRFLLGYGLKQVYKYRHQNTKYKCEFFGRTYLNNGIYPSADFKSYKKRAFETIELNVPVGIEDFLKIRYGDYLKLPSIDEITRQSHAIKFDLDRVFTPRKQGVFADEKYLF